MVLFEDFNLFFLSIFIVIYETYFYFLFLDSEFILNSFLISNESV